MRGVAVMGILLPNILSFALPSDAYSDPRAWGADAPANLWTWAIVFVLAEGKMRGLFSMLFGASTLLIADAAAASGRSAARVHYARMATLAGFGMAHAYLVWSGDILVPYAVAGAIAFAARRLPVGKLAGLVAALMLVQLSTGIATWAAARSFEGRATAPGASPELRTDWAHFRAEIFPSPAATAADLADYRGDWARVSRVRVAASAQEQAVTLPATLPETLAMMLLGMALYRSGFLTGAWSRRRYARVAAACIGATLPLYALLAWGLARAGFDPIAQVLSETVHLVILRPVLAVGYAAAIILAAGTGAARLAAVGRCAFSNYLLSSIVCTSLFYGYGLGWYGQLERWQLYPLVAALWAGMLLWSRPWLDRFAYGPFEWLWRSAARGHLAPFRREVAT